MGDHAGNIYINLGSVMKKIKLNKDVWEYDPATLLGPPGGFGTVYLGKKATGEAVAVKKLHISAGAAGNRELVVSEDLSTKSLKYVIPFFDYGIDADTQEYFIIMAKATKSLQDDLKTGAMSEQIAIGILTEIAKGLKEVGGIIHRDLKPGNVLFHDGIWKLADFGIARFVEDSTSLNTLKDCLSPQ
jgi:serine/threonine-protein kinase